MCLKPPRRKVYQRKKKERKVEERRGKERTRPEQRQRGQIMWLLVGQGKKFA